jgi:polysaccharide chain length determinant protein (PEP-CTERM system associated)
VAEAERALRELRLRFTDQHPDVVAARSALNELRAASSSAPARPAAGAAPRPRAAAVSNPLYEQMKVRLFDLDTQTASLERKVRDEEVETERLETMAREAPQLQAQFQNLDRDYNVLRRNYEELLSRRESVQIAGAARSGTDRVRLEVVDPPVAPSLPSGPNRILFASGVLAAGLAAGVALALLLVQLDRAFYTLHDLRQLGLPVLGSVSAIQAPVSLRLPRMVFASSLALLLLAFGAVLAGGGQIMARLPSLMARIIA